VDWYSNKHKSRSMLLNTIVREENEQGHNKTLNHYERRRDRSID
jgi:hypothetical protein